MDGKLTACNQLRKHYNTTDTGVLLALTNADYNSHERRVTLPVQVLSALSLFDTAGDGTLDCGELEFVCRIASDNAPSHLAAMRVLQQHYGLAGSTELGSKIASDYNNPIRRASLPSCVVAAMQVYDADNSGSLDASELVKIADNNLAPLRKLAAMRLLQKHYGCAAFGIGAGSLELCDAIVADYNDPCRRAALPRNVLAAMQAFDADGNETIASSELSKLASENIHPAPSVVGIKILATYYDSSNMSELKSLVKADYEVPERRALLPPNVLAAIQIYDEDGDDHIDDAEFSQLSTDVARWRSLAYSIAGMRTLRELTVRFAAEIGSALPAATLLAHPSIMTAAWAVSLSYCAVDVGSDAYDAWKLKHMAPGGLGLLAAERASFHALASVVIPYVVVQQVR